eukprot:CAMPEP_0197422536 /NCGR_PEP_ID=MMETSP1170-20131217/16510_1 /TAXON_ID=54406 /ORGANISM="Sarcinochrysis sp, Strain CCMP770" /LENGTH=242 /DNA_ID=CAMNT_0042949879 /DNA_START=6 /DNA_END=734 /DNA_ORIENTATION=+
MLRQALARSAAPGVARRQMSYVQTPASLETVFSKFAEHRACAVLRTPTKEAAPKAMEAAIAGGFQIAEFTMTTPGCLDTLADFRTKYDGKVMVGCGTVMTTVEAEAAMDAGAEFIISPILIPDVVTWCVDRNIVCVPGCQTPTELHQAHKLGAPIQKVFPGVAGAMNWVRAVSAALPMLKLNPTSGVDLDNAGDYLQNGAFGVGLVAPLFPPDVIKAGNFDQVHANALKVIAKVKEAGPYKR